MEMAHKLMILCQVQIFHDVLMFLHSRVTSDGRLATGDVYVTKTGSGGNNRGSVGFQVRELLTC